jgi:hypothetical protein
MLAANTTEPYFTQDPQFENWLGKPLSEEGVYEGSEGSLSEWYNGVHWNTRIRIRSGGPQITDDLVAEGCSEDRATARREAETLMLNRLKGLLSNASTLGLWTIRI